MREYIIKKLGGFASVNDAIDSIKDKETDEQRRILTLAVSDLYNVVSADDLLRKTNEGMKFGDREITPEEYRAISQTAQGFMKSTLFKVVDKDIRHLSNQSLHASKTVLQIAGSEMMQFVWEQLVKRLKGLSV